MATSQSLALVTGANRGLGLEVTKQLAQQGFTVFLGSRDLAMGQQAAAPLLAVGLDVRPVQLDVANPASIAACTSAISQSCTHLDVLVNNAAILYDDWQQAINADLSVVQQALDTNLFGAWRMCQQFLPLLRRSQHARIVNVSSGAGSINEMGSGTPAYSVSKVALNAMTRMLANELRSSNILVNAVCPDWTNTDMGGNGGRPVTEGAASIVWAATLPAGGPTNGFFRDGQPAAW